VFFFHERAAAAGAEWRVVDQSEQAVERALHAARADADAIDEWATVRGRSSAERLSHTGRRCVVPTWTGRCRALRSLTELRTTPSLD